jgi:hypothetical protein
LPKAGTLGWPDIIVAAIMADLGISGGRQIIRQARGELRFRGPVLGRGEPAE